MPVGIISAENLLRSGAPTLSRDAEMGGLAFNVHGAQGPLQAFTALFQYGLFDRFPQVKIVVLESGAGWAGYLLNRMDAVYDSPLGRSVPLKEKPSYYFYRQCWIPAIQTKRRLPMWWSLSVGQILLGVRLSPFRSHRRLYGRAAGIGGAPVGRDPPEGDRHNVKTDLRLVVEHGSELLLVSVPMRW